MKKYNPSDKPPIRATGHCRHYRYNNGPTCSVGVDLSAGGSALKCLPNPNGSCPKREEYTTKEHAEWKEWQEWHLQQVIQRRSGVTRPVPCNTSVDYECPCGRGIARVQRGFARVYISCVCGVGRVEYNLGHTGEWPKSE